MSNFSKQVKRRYERIKKVGTWDSLSDATIYFAAKIFVVNLLLSILGYFFVCLLSNFNALVPVWNMDSVQRGIWLFFILYTLLSTAAFTFLLINIYDKVINKPVKSLLLQMRNMDKGEMTDYLISGKLSKPFASTQEETWIDMVQDYVDTASSEKYLDELTGCFNRKYFQQVLVQYINTYRMANPINPSAPKTYNNDVFAIFLIDIDHFKKVNDDFGHASGDEVLKAVGSTLRSLVNDIGVVIRNGGEEFLVVASAKYPYDFSDLAEKINNAFREHISITAPVTGEVRQITCSVGFVNFPIFEEKYYDISLQQHVDLSDQAMYLSKVSGRNTWREFVALKAPYSSDELEKVITDPNYGVEKGYLSVRMPESDAKKFRITSIPSADSDSEASVTKKTGKSATTRKKK